MLIITNLNLIGVQSGTYLVYLGSVKYLINQVERLAKTMRQG